MEELLGQGAPSNFGGDAPPRLMLSFFINQIGASVFNKENTVVTG